jgi:hypothetical protein
MHRGGTSALTRVLNLLGVYLGRDLMQPAADNAKGFWEHNGIVECHTDLLDAGGSSFDDFLPMPEGWINKPELAKFRERLMEIVKSDLATHPLWGFKDPRTCRLLSLWHELFVAAGAESKFVLMVRNPDEIAESLGQRGGISYNKSLLMTLQHLLAAERDTRGRPRSVVSYDRLLTDWRATVAKVARGLSIQWPVSLESATAAINDFLDVGLRHHHANQPVGAQEAIDRRCADPQIAQWTFAAHEVLLTAANGGLIDEVALDKIHEQFTAAIPSLSAWRSPWSIDEKHIILSRWVRGMDQELNRISLENQKFRRELTRRPGAVEAQALIDEAKARADMAEARAAQAQQAAAREEARATHAELRAVAAEEHVERLLHSLSWEITGPLRAAGRVVNHVLGKTPPAKNPPIPPVGDGPATRG